MILRFLTFFWLGALTTAAGTEHAQGHWSYLPLDSSLPPTVQNTTWIRTPLDKFILARLDEKKISPSPLASGRKLVRRIYFDLVGLPPTPQQVDAFIERFDRDPRSAVESLIDELLASPQYGERWARHWLDVARYADSNGQEATMIGLPHIIIAILSLARSMRIFHLIRFCAGNLREMNLNRTIRRQLPPPVS